MAWASRQICKFIHFPWDNKRYFVCFKDSVSLPSWGWLWTRDSVASPFQALANASFLRKERQVVDFPWAQMPTVAGKGDQGGQPGPLPPPGGGGRRRARSEARSRAAPAAAWPGLTRDAVVLRGGAGQAARQVRGELDGVAVTARHPQRPHRTHPARLQPLGLPAQAAETVARKKHTTETLSENLGSPGRPGGSVDADARNPGFWLGHVKGDWRHGDHFSFGQSSSICSGWNQLAF